MLQIQAQELWGMTSAGGTDRIGTIIKTDANGNNQSVVYSFKEETPGGLPHYTKLCQASNGKLYGMTREGGANDQGVLFEYDPVAITYTKKLDFDGAAKGQLPFGSLVQASNGKLYGMTRLGGALSQGVLFEYDPVSSTYTKKVDLDSSNGARPEGSLVQSFNGKLYGMTEGGGFYDKGVLFEYDPVTSTYTKKVDFDGTAKGKNPKGSLFEASNGKLYGMTSYGGTLDLGVLFEYAPVTDTYNKKAKFWFCER